MCIHTHPDPRLLLVAKWGGELTLSGRRQAEGLGASFQRCYYSQASGGSSQRDDLKVFASDEGRVQVTAASFTKVSASLHARMYILKSFVTPACMVHNRWAYSYPCMHVRICVCVDLAEPPQNRCRMLV